MITGFGRTGKNTGACSTPASRPTSLLLENSLAAAFRFRPSCRPTKLRRRNPGRIRPDRVRVTAEIRSEPASSNEALKIIEDEGLVENSRSVGAYFLMKLQPFVEKYSFIGEARGRGLMLALEFVKR